MCIYRSTFYHDIILEAYCSVFCVVGDAFCRCDGLHEVYIPLCNSLSCVYRSFDKLGFSAAVCQHAGRGLSASVDSQDTFWIFSRSIHAQQERRASWTCCCIYWFGLHWLFSVNHAESTALRTTVMRRARELLAGIGPCCVHSWARGSQPVLVAALVHKWMDDCCSSRLLAEAVVDGFTLPEDCRIELKATMTSQCIHNRITPSNFYGRHDVTGLTPQALGALCLRSQNICFVRCWLNFDVTWI